MKVHIYSTRSSVSLFNGREIFWLCHDASRWWQGHHHPTGGWQRSWEALRLSEIAGGDLPSFLSFRSAGGGTWAVAGCRNDVARLAYFSQRSGQTYPDRICRSSGCDMAVIRMWCLRVSCASPEGVWIGEARHVSSWGNPDGANPDKNVCHVSSGGGVPTWPTCILEFSRQIVKCYKDQLLPTKTKGGSSAYRVTEPIKFNNFTLQVFQRKLNTVQMLFYSLIDQHVIMPKFVILLPTE